MYKDQYCTLPGMISLVNLSPFPSELPPFVSSLVRLGSGFSLLSSESKASNVRTLQPHDLAMANRSTAFLEPCFSLYKGIRNNTNNTRTVGILLIATYYKLGAT